MAKGEDAVAITIIAFGPIGEHLGGRQHEREVPPGSTVRDVVEALGLKEWITFGLSVAIDGNRCAIETVLQQGAELALLPPVSGG